MMASQGIKDKKILILGTDRDALSMGLFLKKNGASVSFYEESLSEEKKQERFANFPEGLEALSTGEFQSKNLEGQNLVLFGMSYALAHNLLNDIRQSGVELMGFVDFVAYYSTAPIVAVAGTSGKRTTAYLLENMLLDAGKKVASNAQQPIAEVLENPNLDYIVLAINSLYVEDFKHFKPKTLLFLNLAEELPDPFPNLNDYMLWQKRVLRNVDDDTSFVLNSQDLSIVSFVQGLQGRTLFFGAQEVPEGFEGAWSNKKSLLIRVKESEQALNFDVSNFRMRGPHNRENLMAAALAALSLGVKAASVQKVINELKGLPHRLQFVKRVNSVAFYNDSAATNCTAVSRALYSFNEPIILIMGGKEVNANFASLAPHVRLKVKNLILVGEAKERVNRSLGDFTETFLVGTMEEAILIAYQKSRSGDVILMSPGCPSGDAFKDLEERGDFFRNMILGFTQVRKPHLI
ncbi:MAG: UDP-N-acetylmuramoyl-L-alanine--D-glutamate ligase [Proteobacteria bacterium]|nr:UDP-N-acetylmuramoyl-L-alanine--D-glutamate ligase [Pseudomonadota bacterium]